MDLFNLQLKADARSFTAAAAAMDKFTVSAQAASTAAERLNKQTGDSLKRVAATATEAAAVQKRAMAGQVADYRIWAATGHQAATSHIGDLRKMEAAGHQAKVAEKARLTAQTADYRIWGATSHQAMQSQIADLRKWEAAGHQANTALKQQAASAKVLASSQAQVHAEALRMNRAFDQQTLAVNRLTGGYVSLHGVFITLAVIGAITAATTAFARLMDATVVMTTRIRMFTTSAAEAVAVTKELKAIADQNRASIVDTTNLYTKLVTPMTAMAEKTKGLVSAQRLSLDTTRALSAALLVGGASTAEASAATIQFAQAMSSGVLRGDEFRSMAENAPRFLTALADGLGVPREALRGLAEQGFLTATRVAGALISQLIILQAESVQFGATIGGAGRLVGNEFLKMSGEVNKAVGISEALAVALKSLIPVIKAVGNTIISVAENFRGIAGAMIGAGLAYAGFMAAVSITTAISAAGGLVVFLGAAALRAAVAVGGLRVALLTLQTAIPLLGWITAVVGAGAGAWLAYKLNAEDAAKASDKTAQEEAARLAEINLQLDKMSARPPPNESPAARMARQTAEAIEVLVKAEKDAGYSAEHLAKVRASLNEKAKEGLEIQKALIAQAGIPTSGATAAAVDPSLQFEDQIVDLFDVNALLAAGLELQYAQLRVQLARNGATQEQIKVIEEEMRLQDKLTEAKKEVDALEGFEDKNFGGGFAEGFDNASRSLAAFVTGFDDLIDASEYYAKSREKYKKSDIDLAKIEVAEQRTQIKLYGNLAGAAKGFFSEGSKGYKALEAAETAFRAVELALAIKSLFVKAQIAVANQANGDPYTAWARMAAMAAAMAALGAYVGGGGAGRRANAQSNLSKGQGTTLGDPSAVSESIAKSVEITANASEKLVGINYAMLNSLRALESQATGVGDVALREGINVPQISGLNATFGTLKSGIQLPAQDFAKLIIDPIINTFTQGAYTTAFGEAGAEIIAMIRNAFGNISDTVMAGAMTLGMTEAQVRAAFGNIQMPEFRIDTQGMSGEQINEAFNKWLSAVFDQVAIETLAAGGVDLKNFAVGAETWAETMARLVVEVSVLNDAYTAMHIPMTATIELADEMARAFGGVEQMLEGFSMFVDLFFSDQEKNDLLRGQLGKGFAALGQQLPETKAAFRAMVEAALAVGNSDLVAGLLAMQEPFVKLIEGVEDAAGEVNKLVSSLRDLRDEAARHVAATQAPSVQLGRLRSQFQSQSALAGLGNSEAAALLPALGKDFMSASLQFAGSQSEYIRDLAMIQIGAERAAQAQERPRMTAFAGAAAGSFDTAPVVNEVQMLREEVKAGLYVIAKNTAKTEQWLSKFDGDGMPEVREA